MERKLHALFVAALWTTVVVAGAEDLPPPRTPPADSDIARALRPSDYSMTETRDGLAGAWGQLEVTATMIEPAPDSLEGDAVSFLPVAWEFTGIAPEGLPTALARAGMSSGQVQLAMSDCSTSAATGNAVVDPPEALMLGLDADVRYRVYALLRESALNRFYKYPFQVSTRFEASWFEKASLSPQTEALVAKLIYRHNGVSYLSDFRFILDRIDTAGERKAFYMALLRQVTLRARLKVPAPDEVDRIAVYWGARGRSRDVYPLLDAASRGLSTWSISIVLLLPPFPRERLYTYDHATDDAFRDCIWTALNVFNVEEDDRLLDRTYASALLFDSYDSVSSDLALGDVILLRDRKGTILHVCNYVADNLVFTKNGGDKGQPWVLSTLRDVVNYYTIGDEAPEVLFLRERTAAR